MTKHSRPALTGKARLRFDPISDEYLLLFPERGLILNGTASQILRLCTGANTVAMIVDHLATSHPDSSRTLMEQDVWEFLHELNARGLIRETDS